MSEYTKEWHVGEIGTTKPALCGALPPDGRPWRKAPEALPACLKCAVLRTPNSMALAS